MMNSFKIKASAEYIVPGFSFDLIAVKQLPDMSQKAVAVEWSVCPSDIGINVCDGTLKIDKNIQNIDQLTIYAKDICTSDIVQRTFQVTHTNYSGKLIHFIKNDHLYKGENFSWDLWTYDDKGTAAAIDLSEGGDFGVTAFTQNDHVIVRKRVWGSSYNDWAEQTVTFTLDLQYDNYYIIYGDTKAYTALEEVVKHTNPRIDYARMDDSNHIIAYLSHPPLSDTIFELYLNSVKQNEVVVSVRHIHKQVVFTNLPAAINPWDVMVIKASATFPPAVVTMRNYLNNFYYSANDMGVVFKDSSINLKLWAPTAQQVELLLYSTWAHQPELPDYCLVLERDLVSGTHFITVNRHEFEGFYYLYRLTFTQVDENNDLFAKTSYAVDPYTCGLSVNGECGVLLDLDSAEVTPVNWCKDKKPPLLAKEDAIIYELHVRDFTIAAESGVKDEFRGKYLGVAETGCCYVSADGVRVSTGIDSLVELGITHVHLLPIFDFATVDETQLEFSGERNWGYDPKNYNVPDGSYSLDPYNPLLRIKETRQMIQGLHKNGIRVVMDVVYNHMHETTNLDKIVPGYYFRTDDQGRFTNGSGCGNELATERPMVSKLITDSIMHWVNDYKIDGVRLDLMELMDLDTMKNIVKQTQAADPSILIYGEPWKGGDSPLANGTYRGCQKNEEFSIFNDFFRDAIRGNNNPGHGFVNGGQHHALNCHNIVEGLKGFTTSLTVKPVESINYVDAHDNYTLWDHIEKSQNPGLRTGNYQQNISDTPLEDILVRQNLLALGIILTAQGIPFLHGGVEVLRTKNGDHNSYKSSDEINAFHWQDKVRFKSVFDYVKGLIELRSTHPAFRMSTRKLVEDHLSVYSAHHDENSGVIVAYFRNYANGDSWRDIVVIYNATTIENYAINDLLPHPESGVWQVVVNHEQAGTKTLSEHACGNLPPLKSHSLLVIHS